MVWLVLLPIWGVGLARADYSLSGLSASVQGGTVTYQVRVCALATGTVPLGIYHDLAAASVVGSTPDQTVQATAGPSCPVNWGSQCDKTEQMCGCAAAAHCGAATFGPKCDTDLAACSCAADADCAASAFGKLCDTTDTSACSCAGTSDCPTGKTCTGDVGQGAWSFCK